MHDEHHRNASEAFSSALFVFRIAGSDVPSAVSTFAAFLASVDQNTYTPNSPLRMGDHPAVWTNEHIKARNVVRLHWASPRAVPKQSFHDPFHNSIIWAAHL